MVANKLEQTAIIITGMHRSGTSFTASLLQSAGLCIGQRLIGPGNGNVKGFFEQVDFVEFHQDVLRSQELNDVGWTLQDPINIQAQHVQQAKEIISQNAVNSIWGWKDPRTALFLDFWFDLLPEANFLFIYRSPWEVVDSLYRRGDDIFIEHPELAVELWMHYNQKILNFYDRHAERCLLVDICNVTQQPKAFIEAVNQKFNINLTNPLSSLYEQSLFHNQAADAQRSSLVNYYFPEASKIYQALSQRELQARTFDPAHPKPAEVPSERFWAFRDWVNIRHLEQQVKRLTAGSG